MSNKKQSSIIHIRSWVRTNGKMSEDGKSITYSCAELEAVIREAKAIHRKEIIDAHWNGVEFPQGVHILDDSIDYYNETFGGQDNE